LEEWKDGRMAPQLRSLNPQHFQPLLTKRKATQMGGS
jgi:hypothetical protein